MEAKKEDKKPLCEKVKEAAAIKQKALDEKTLIKKDK